MKTDLWPLPVQNMFGVGKRMGHHLNKMGIRTIGDLARFPLKRLQKRWGIPGQVLWMTANGHDLSPVSPDTFEHQKAIGHQMTLPRDYRTAEEIRVVLLELCEEVCRRTRCHHLLGQTVSVGCRGRFSKSVGISPPMQTPGSNQSDHGSFSIGLATVFAFLGRTADPFAGGQLKPVPNRSSPATQPFRRPEQKNGARLCDGRNQGTLRPDSHLARRLPDACRASAQPGTKDWRS